MTIWFFFFTLLKGQNTWFSNSKSILYFWNICPFSWYVAFIIEIVLLIFCLQFFASIFMSELGLCLYFLILFFLWSNINIMIASEGAEEYIWHWCYCFLMCLEEFTDETLPVWCFLWGMTIVQPPYLQKEKINPGKRVTYLASNSHKCFTYLMYLRLLRMSLIVKGISRFFYFSQFY